MQQIFTLFLGALLLIQAAGFAQTQDSLEQVVNRMPADTAKVIELFHLSRKIASNDAEKAHRYAQQALDISWKLDYMPGEALGLIAQGNAYRFQGQHELARTYLEKGHAIAEKTRHPLARIHAMNGVGLLHYFESDYEKAFYHLIQALRIAENINDKSIVQNLLNNIALICNEQGNYKQAISYFEQSLRLKKELGDKKGIASTLNNMAIAYCGIKDTLHALKLHEQSLQIKRELDDDSGIAFSLFNLGQIHRHMGNYTQAHEMLTASLAIRTRINDKISMASNLEELGMLYQKRGMAEKALYYFNQSLQISEELKAKDEIKELYQRIAEIYASQNNYKAATELYQKCVRLSEELFSETNARQLAEMQTKYETEQKEKAIVLLNKEKEAEHTQSVLVRNSLLGGLSLLSCLLFVAFIGYRQKQKANLEISRKNQLLESQKIELEHQKSEIMAQRDEIEAKNETLNDAYEKINRQKDEILKKNAEMQKQQAEIVAQRNSIEAKNKTLEQVNAEIITQSNALEKAYDNIKILSQIGQEITSILDVKTIVETVYGHINMLMEASGFGIGLYDEARQEIVFEGFIENSITLPQLRYSLNSPDSFAAWCLRNHEVICINHLEKEYQRYITRLPEQLVTHSLIYVPLTIESRTIGVITVQSAQENAYNDYHTNILQTLASYIAIALDNANAYRVIETKNTHITNSIRYAQTIQQAILPVDERMKTAFADFFVLYQPKDVVSGDFYWFSQTPEQTFMAVIDCTGHGVPGAFMSLIGNTILNKIVAADPDISPAVLLEKLHTEVRSALRQDSSTNDDGMDVCIAAIRQDGDFAVVTFAGAKRPIYYVDVTGIMTEIKGDGKSIGGRQREARRVFTERQFRAQKGGCIYLSTDGFTDQNNAQREKFGSARLKTVLEELALQPMETQQKMLVETLKTFQRTEEQRDDITIVGIRI